MGGRPKLKKPIQGNPRADALDALSQDQRKRLAAYAEILSRGTGNDAEDLLHEAVARWLASDKPILGPEHTCDFLRGAIKSIRSNAFRHEKVVRRYEGVRAVAAEGEGEDPLNQASDPAASPEGLLFVQQLYDLCEDEEIQSLLIAQLDKRSPVETQAELGWDEKKYKAVQKRKARLVIRWKLEGKLT
jgi:DNA-directed RNA polymerase specialized sigma24 family protein